MIQITITIDTTEHGILSVKSHLARLDCTSGKSEMQLGALVNSKLGELIESISQHAAPGVNSVYVSAPPDLYDGMEKAASANLREQQQNGGRS